MPYDPITLSKSDEYFIAIAKKGIHTFLMLGAMQNGSPTLFSRVGKWNDVDPNADSPVHLTMKQVGSSNLTRIKDEDINWEGYNTSISYQAYSLTFEQSKEFMSLIAYMEKEQLNNPEIKAGIIRAWKRDYPASQKTDEEILNQDAIRSYVPCNEVDNKVTFQWTKLQEANLISNVDNRNEISIGSQKLSASNTCRTTALNMVKSILGFDPDVSKHFFISPKYKTTLEEGQPNKTNFYVFPPPPVIDSKQFSNAQLDVLTKLYKKMEQLPKQNPNSPKTREKFDALKSTYTGIMGKPKLNVYMLLKAIEEHEDRKSDSLFAKRDPNFFSNLFSIKSSTEKMFVKFKAELQKEIKKGEEGEKPHESSTLKIK